VVEGKPEHLLRSHKRRRSGGHYPGKAREKQGEESRFSQSLRHGAVSTDHELTRMGGRENQKESEGGRSRSRGLGVKSVGLETDFHK